MKSKSVHPSTLDQVKLAVSPSKLAPEKRINLSYNLVADKAAFEEIQNRFKSTDAGGGMSMEEFSRRYWEDEQFREKVKMDIALRRRS